MIRETESGKGRVKLSVKDKKLLQLLLQDSRMSVTQLAKKVGISKPAVTQKIESLKKRGILNGFILFTNVNSFDESLYVLGISTQLGATTKEVNEKLLGIKEITGILWYNGVFNLVLAIDTTDPQEVIEKIEGIIRIKKLRITRARGHWFHPPHLFKEIKDKNVDFNHMDFKADEVDKKIIDYLHNNPTANFAEISGRTKLSPVTIKKRLEKLEKSGAILGFGVFLDPWLCGKEVIGISLIVKGKKEVEKIIKHLLKIPQTANVWEFDHEWNVGFVLWVDNQADVNKILNGIYNNFKILDTEISVLVGMVGK